jgi:transaldolase
MKIFLDTAHLATIQQWAETGLIDGVTSNPSHLSKEGGDPKKIINDICALLPEGDISVQVTEKSPEAVYKQAKAIAKLAPNIIVKVPCAKEYYPVIKKLVAEGVKVNITLLFTLVQALFMCKLGVRYISPFIGRLDDIDVDGLALIAELRQMIDTYGFETQILAASIRDDRHFHGVILFGADAATVPVTVLEKAATHPLTDQGRALFDADWAKLGIRQFP